MHATIVLPIGTAPGAALEALTALAALPEEPAFEVVVVDDASVGLEPLLAGLEGDVEVVRLEQPAGLAAAVAAGIARARGEHVVVLAGPARVDPSFLGPLLSALAQDPELQAAAAGPAASPVAAHALAFRRDALPPGEVPAVADHLVLAALAAQLGRSAVVAASLVHPPAARGGAPAQTPGGDPELTVVIPTLDAAGPRTARCIRAIQAATDVPHEIVVVDNGAPPQGFSAPVNSGLRAARGAYAVVCNDDVEVLPGWWAPLRAALDDEAAVAFPLTIDGAMRTDFAAWCFAVSRATLERHAVVPGEFLHPELRVWYQDTDLLHRLRQAGVPPRFVPESRIRHGLSETVGTADPALRAWIDTQIRADRQRFEQLHGADVAGAAR